MFSFADLLGRVSGRGTEGLWWLDLTVLGGWSSSALIAVCATLLAAWALWPRVDRVRRIVTVAAAAALSCVAAFNTGAFYRAWGEGRIEPGVPVPFSVVVGSVLVGIAFAAGRVQPVDAFGRGRSGAGWLGWTLVAVLLFPVAHIVFFGTTDYRRPADAVVVFGARVHASGALSSSLRDRVETAVELYREGLAPLVIMSGGIDMNGTDEAAAMAGYAIARGVEPSALVLDSAGVNTDATVANVMRRVGPGARLLAVSQSYHLPRVKMAFRLAGADVATVPARELEPIPQTPVFVLREIPAFWVYWARGLTRGR